MAGAHDVTDPAHAAPRGAAALDDTHAASEQTQPPVSLEAPVAAGAWLLHHEIIRELGRGGMGRVFLARDTRLGRLVAIKLVTVRSPALVERFLLEARATARCSHENIVVIHDVGEHDGWPYMVLEYLEGESLGKLMARGPLSPSRAIELAVPIARALSRAHGVGIIHRDLKPENVFVTSTGQVKVLDFGIARLFAGPPAHRAGGAGGAGGHSTTGDHGGLIGTLPYMAPEQLAMDEVDARADLWALGVILHEAIAGAHPLAPVTTGRLFDEAAHLERPMPRLADAAPHAPRELARIVERCLAKPLDERWRSAAELLEALEPLLPVRRGRGVSDAEPFPGLRAFQESDADRFFGRDAEVARVTQRIRERPLVAVVGASGVGKSSLVRAGVIPALRSSGETWEAEVIRPGRAPLAALAALAHHVSSSGGSGSGRGSVDDELEARRGLEVRLRDEPGHLGRLLRARAAQLGGSVLIFVDQFEELYTLVDDLEERRAFVRALAALADDPDAPLRVALSMRADLLARVAEDARFSDALTRGLVFLSSPDRAGLRAALEGPAELAGYRFEPPALVDRMLDDLGASRDALPLLSFAASRLWERRDRAQRVLGEDAYAVIGGVAGALARHAEEIVEAMPASRRLLRALLLRLVTADGSRAIVELAELRALGDASEVDVLVEQLAAGRLVVVHGGDAGGAVELTHESLIERWPTLRRWREEDHDDAALIEQLRGAARQWEQRGHDAGLLWRGDAVADARRLLGRQHAARMPREDAYLRAVVASADRATRRRRAAVIGAMALLLAVAVAASIGLMRIRGAERDARDQASVAGREADRAREAEVRATAELERARQADQARAAAEAAAGQATQREQLSLEELQQANARLLIVLEDAQATTEELVVARKAAEQARAAAEAAAARSRDDATRIQALADEASRARAEAERLLKAERARAQRLERELTQINTELK